MAAPKRLVLADLLTIHAGPASTISRTTSPAFDLLPADLSDEYLQAIAADWRRRALQGDTIARGEAMSSRWSCASAGHMPVGRLPAWNHCSRPRRLPRWPTGGNAGAPLSPGAGGRSRCDGSSGALGWRHLSGAALYVKGVSCSRRAPGSASRRRAQSHWRAAWSAPGWWECRCSVRTGSWACSAKMDGITARIWASIRGRSLRRKGLRLAKRVARDMVVSSVRWRFQSRPGPKISEPFRFSGPGVEAAPWSLLLPLL